MMENPALHEQALALTALFTACDGVLALAKRGQWAEDNFNAMLPSLFTRNAASIEGYYPDLSRLSVGRDLLLEMMAEGVPREHMQYVMQIMYVERKLSKNKPLMAKLIADLHAAEQQKDHFGLLSETVFARLGEIYSETASVAARKIRVVGEPAFLRQSDIAARVRALLLCGVRAAGLWRASGGGRWQLMFSRQAIAQAARNLMLS